MPDTISHSSESAPMRFTGSMITLVAPPLAAGALAGSLLAGEWTGRARGDLLPPSSLAVSVDGQHFTVVTDTEDRGDRDVDAAEFAQWARSMMGGDTSHMLDL